jgi:hypothetical protein
MNTGISVELPLTFENRKHIFYLVYELGVLRVFIKQENVVNEYTNMFIYERDETDEDDGDDGDEEMTDNENDENDISLLKLKNLSETTNEDEFNILIGNHVLTFFFIYPFVEVYYDPNNTTYDQTITIDNLLTRVRMGKELFLMVGVPENKIKVGYVL